ncbi:MAG: hypothetical protein FWG50_11880, partial [Kiritimatiellaeota bacterium]|nr:hypothetical protein [Kiritimatiellota bacterium]
PEILALTKGGVLFEPNNADALADAVTLLLEAPRDIPHGVTQHFSIHRMARDTLAAYEAFSAGHQRD